MKSHKYCDTTSTSVPTDIPDNNDENSLGDCKKSLASNAIRENISIEQETPSDKSVTDFNSKWYSNYYTAVNQAQSIMNWLVENRLGVSKLLSFRLISAQITSIPSFCMNSPENGFEVIEKACEPKEKENYTFEKIMIPCKSRSGFLNAVICYPPNWDRNDKSKCIIFNNQNGATVSKYIDGQKLAMTSKDDPVGIPTDTPGNYQAHNLVPMILYDYSGTGINQDKGFLRLMPTASAKTIASDGEDVLAYTLSEYDEVVMFGSSMGGYVANSAVINHLESISDKDEANRIAELISVVNHDSFTTTSRTLTPLPSKIADSIGWFVGAHADSELPMSKIIYYPVKVTILSHKYDKTIPVGSRMIDFISEITEKSIEETNKPLAKIKVFESSHGEHSCLSKDQIEHLEQ